MDTVFVLASDDGDLAEQGTNESDTGPMAFATADEAEQFKNDMDEAGALFAPFRVRQLTMNEIIERAHESTYWTHLWTRGGSDENGNRAWYAMPLPRK
jgi:hypothetical protein